MRKQLNLLTTFLASMAAFCAFVVLALSLCTLSACTSAGGAAASAPPAVSAAQPSEQATIALPDPSAQLSESAAPDQSAPASAAVTQSPTQPAVSAAPAPGTQPPAAVSQPPVQAGRPAAAFPEIPLDEYSQKITVPDFLTQDQQLLYRQAHAMYSRMFGSNVFISIGMEDKFPDLPDWQEHNGIAYTKALGQYAAWADFDAMIHSLFTDQFWTNRNAVQRGRRYINLNGALYFLDLSRVGCYRNDNFPDTFQLKSKTDDEIVFTLTGYYSSPWPKEGETNEQRDQRLKDGWEYTLDFNVKLVRTEDGWRFDNFHSTMADQEDPETAAMFRRLAD